MTINDKFLPVCFCRCHLLLWKVDNGPILIMFMLVWMVQLIQFLSPQFIIICALFRQLHTHSFRPSLAVGFQYVHVLPGFFLILFSFFIMPILGFLLLSFCYSTVDCITVVLKGCIVARRKDPSSWKGNHSSWHFQNTRWKSRDKIMRRSPLFLVRI